MSMPVKTQLRTRAAAFRQEASYLEKQAAQIHPADTTHRDLLGRAGAYRMAADELLNAADALTEPAP